MKNKKSVQNGEANGPKAFEPMIGSSSKPATRSTERPQLTARRANTRRAKNVADSQTSANTAQLVFISYSNKDRTSVLPTVKRIKSMGVEAWFDEHKIVGANNIPLAMSHGLNASSHLLIFWSRASAESWIVLDELTAFYMKDPRPDRILFVRLDDTPLHCLFGARRSVQLEPHALSARAIQCWLAGIGEGNFEPPTAAPPNAALLQSFPRGPAASSNLITFELAREYALLFGTEAAASAKIAEANRLRLLADPAGEERSMCLDPVTMPSLRLVPSWEYWWDVLHRANLKGPRMLAAILLVVDDSGFCTAAKRDRANLLQTLRALWNKN